MIALNISLPRLLDTVLDLVLRPFQVYGNIRSRSIGFDPEIEQTQESQPTFILKKALAL